MKDDLTKELDEYMNSRKESCEDENDDLYETKDEDYEDYEDENGDMYDTENENCENENSPAITIAIRIMIFIVIFIIVLIVAIVYCTISKNVYIEPNVLQSDNAIEEPKHLTDADRFDYSCDDADDYIMDSVTIDNVDHNTYVLVKDIYRETNGQYTYVGSVYKDITGDDESALTEVWSMTKIPVKMEIHINFIILSKKNSCKERNVE